MMNHEDVNGQNMRSLVVRYRNGDKLSRKELRALDRWLLFCIAQEAEHICTASTGSGSETVALAEDSSDDAT